MTQPTILITGANGQLGSELKVLSNSYPQLQCIFTTREELPVENSDVLEIFFRKYAPEYLINAAAYTAVDKAESDKENAFLINSDAVSGMAGLCKKYSTQFIHISTDYVFDGNSQMPYTENSLPNPMSVYGTSKLMGEQKALQVNPHSLIIRTSWVYSKFGKNFVKTMLRLMKEKQEIKVVNDQFGSPTYAADLAKTLFYVVANQKKQIEASPGIYHFSNKGIISWYEFALEIKNIMGYACMVLPIPTTEYPTLAKRPGYSALNTSKIQETFDVELEDWRDSLTQCLEQIKNAL